MARMTKQKKLLLGEMKHFTSFFDAYTLHARVAKKDPRIGLATVYRFLAKLEEDHLVHSFLCGSKKVYSQGKTSHAHFRCEVCAKTKHIAIRDVSFLQEIADGEVCHFQIELAGVCAECMEKR